jgi:hypothetical protein
VYQNEGSCVVDYFFPPSLPVLQWRLMGDSNPKNKQKQQAQHSAKKASNQKKPAGSSVPTSGKKK